MREKQWLFLTILLLTILPYSWGQGLIVPPPRPIPPDPSNEGLSLPIDEYKVETEIDNQMAVTTVTQVFRNPHNRQVEGTYLFAVPEQSSVSEFTLEVDGEQVKGELLDQEEALKVYESIVRKHKDPGVLYYNGQGLIRARIFPIEPKKTKTIQVRYEEILSFDHGACNYQFSLATKPFCHKKVDYVGIDIDIQSKEPIKNVFSPNHEITTNRINDHHVKVKYSEENIRPEHEFLLTYDVSQDAIGINLFSYKEKEEDGFFMLLAAPSVERDEEEEIAAKNVVLVLDRSGSMKKDNKIQQAREALEFCLRSLNAKDHYAVIFFNDDIETLTESLTPYEEHDIDGLCKKIQNLDAQGGTNIDGALQEALRLVKKPERPTYVLFMTDGLPTVGERDADKILSHVKELNTKENRFFTFGVGYDVNTFLLDQLAQNNKGLATYVKPNQDIEVSVSNMYSKISKPILTDIELDFDNIAIDNMYPRELPDVFHGSQLVVLGRYKDGRNTTLKLRGTANNRDQTFLKDVEFSKEKSKYDYIPRLWAARRIGYLIDEIRLHGKNQELVEEIMRLSEKYGILTEYTSFLVQEAPVTAQPLSPSERETQRTRNLSKAEESLSFGFGMERGSQAVSNAEMLQDQLKNAPSLAQQNRVKHYDREGNVQTSEIGDVTYNNSQAYFRRGEQWVSTQFDANKEVIKIAPYSKAYFQLANLSKNISQTLAMGENVSFVQNGIMVQIDPDGEEELDQQQLNRLQE